MSPHAASPLHWTTLGSEILVDRWWMKLRQDRVLLPDGNVLDEYHVVEYPDWVCVLALTSGAEAVLVEQYRYGIDRVILELPAGMIDPGEDPLEAARRELREETGFEGEQWDRLGRLAVEPGRHTNYGHVYVARGCTRVGEPVLDATENLEVRVVEAKSLASRVERGEIAHGVHAAAVFWAQSRGWLDEPGSGGSV
ncbi:NUDIX hydrolase [Rubrivirga sp.]|uniref:NUDIX hydrolase n=1 Tax=Rubrivirga sp. TaxID=1885344 RepID=UPI003C744290